MRQKGPAGGTSPVTLSSLSPLPRSLPAQTHLSTAWPLPVSGYGMSNLGFGMAWSFCIVVRAAKGGRPYTIYWIPRGGKREGAREVRHGESTKLQSLVGG